MNHSQALSSTPQDRCLLAILQFLKDSGLTETLTTLQHESHRQHSDPLPGDENLLLTALMHFDERRNAFKTKALTDDETRVETALNALKLTDESVATHEVAELTPHASNITTVKWQPLPTSSLLASGGVDKTVYVTDTERRETRNAIPLTAPVLTLDWCRTAGSENLLLAGCMNGDCCLLDIDATPPVRQRVHDHTKYVVGVKWSPDGRMFATASHDCTVCIYTYNPTDPAATDAATLHHRFEYRNPVESLVWLSDTLLCLSPREDNYLHVVDAVTRTTQQKVNMNLTGDDHVSFSAMHTAVSPDRTLVAVATDQHRLLVLLAGSAVQVRNYWGLQNDGYSTPRVCWSRCGRYVYVTQQDVSVCCYDVSEGRCAGVLRGHDTNVRDVDCHAYRDELSTCSFDRTIKLWSS